MNTYIIQILEILLSNNGKADIPSVIAQLKITKRMFLYYRKQLNEYLLQSKLPQTRMEDDIVCMEVSDSIHVIHTLMAHIQIENYILNANERQECILIIIGIRKDPVVLEHLIDEFKISRNTMIHDLGMVKKYLASYGIKLLNRLKQGYYFEGDELLIRYVIMKAYHHRDNVYINAFKKQILLAQLQSYTTTNPFIIDRVQDILVASEQLGNETFIFLALQDLSQTILLMYMRGYHRSIPLDLDIILEKNKIMLEYIVKELRNIGIILNHSQAGYLCLILQAAKVSRMDKQEYEEAVVELAQAIISEFEAISQLNLFYQKEISDMFLLHVKSMYYRTKYKIKITDFQEAGTEENQGFYYITKKVMENVRKKFDLIVEEDEIRFLSYYFSCMEKNCRDEVEHTKENIVVICVSGLGSSVYLKYQLTKLFENSISILISDLRNMDNIINENTKLIVTTIDLERKQCKGKEIKKVNTVLTQLHKQELLEWFLNDAMYCKENMVVNDVIDIIKSYTIIQNQEKLFRHLNQYFIQEPKGGKELQLKDLLEERYVSIYDKAASWQEMIYLAGKSLVADDVIAMSYLHDIEVVIQQYGLYCECLNGILVAHAEPLQNVKRPVLSLAVFHQPLYVKAWNKEITSVFILGVVDKQSHGNAFSQLITNLSQNTLYKKLNEFTSANELFHAIIDE